MDFVYTRKMRHGFEKFPSAMDARDTMGSPKTSPALKFAYWGTDLTSISHFASFGGCRTTGRDIGRLAMSEVRLIVNANIRPDTIGIRV